MARKKTVQGKVSTSIKPSKEEIQRAEKIFRKYDLPLYKERN